MQEKRNPLEILTHTTKKHTHTHTSHQVKNDFHYNSNANWDDVNLNHINHWPQVNWLFEARKGLPTEQKRIERTIRVTIGKVITRLTWIPKRAEKYRLKIYNWVWGQNGYQLIAPRSCHFPQLTLARCKAYIYIFSFFLLQPKISFPKETKWVANLIELSRKVVVTRVETGLEKCVRDGSNPKLIFGHLVQLNDLGESKSQVG